MQSQGREVHPLSLRDPPLDGEVESVLIDWDSLDPDGREAYLAYLLAHPGDRRIGLHSYSLNEDDAGTLRRKGVAVFERLEPDALAWLLDGTG
jgi:hypothetical protein